MKKQRKCYICTRVSTAIQVDGYSLDARKDKLRKYAEYQDMTIVSEFSDEGCSGKNIKGVGGITCGKTYIRPLIKMFKTAEIIDFSK